jgi:aspartyl-tRNA(Asn)/glutamyl-tRNA(Gln) amidotransferase subunit B
MAEYEAVIGLEVHVQLKTDSKVFCGCPTRFGGEPNTQVCPVCLGLPGVLPVLNEKALRYAVIVGLMLDCQVSRFSKFDRKNYFYPDLPKNYQISQYDLPLCTGGSLKMEVDGEVKKIGITRVHLEEDAGKLVHDETHGGDSGVDFNRTGIPLLEIVSEPELSSPEEAFAYLRSLKLTLQYLGVSDCDMEKGSLRCDANVSVRPQGTQGLGVKTEVKNMNSFKAVQKALAYEIERQTQLLIEGGEVVQETRLWEADSEMTHPMRSKEEAHDYRYFPEPDLVPVVVQEAWLEELRRELPEPPLKRRERFLSDYGIPEYDAGVLIAEKDLADYFEACVKAGVEAKIASNWVMGEMLKEIGRSNTSIGECKVKPEALMELIGLVEKGAVSLSMAKEVFAEMFETGRAAAEIVERRGLKQISDEGALRTVVDEVIEANPGSVEDYRGGKKKAIGFLIGQVMKATKGKANPQVVNKIMTEKLS